MDTIALKPAPGCMVRDPATKRLLPEKGEEKPRTSFWLRRIADGSCIEVEPKKEVKDK